MIEPLDIELVEQPVAELREMAEVTRGDHDPRSPPTRASTTARRPSAPPRAARLRRSRP